MMNIIKIDSEDCAHYRKSLLNVMQAAVQNDQNLIDGWPSGNEISDCMSILLCLEDAEEVTE